MKKVLTTLAISLTLPLVALAAFDSVQIPSGTTLVFSVGGSDLNFTVTDGNVENVEAAAASVTFTMAPGSAISINSSDRKNFGYSVNRTIASLQCTSSASIINLSLAGSEGSNEVVTVTPNSTTCTVPSGGAGGGGGGGGGSPAPAPAPAPTPTPTPAPTPTPPVAAVVTTVPAATVAQPSPVAQLVSPVFNKDLTAGSRGDDIKRLQELLAQDKDIYPEGLTTGYYGNATLRAVKKFQTKYGLPSVGRVGPATRAKLQEVFGGSAAPAVPATPAAPAVAPAAKSQQEQLQDALKQLQELQAKLKAQ